MSSQRRKAAQLFVIGQPRSGTKLLRGLLNQHPKLGILYETNCLPYWWNSWEKFGDLGDFRNFSAFYRDAVRIPFFINQAQLGRRIPCELWHRSCQNFTVGSVFEAMALWYASIDKGPEIIWGDKSPTYLPHVGLLKRVFPDARFIHIVRDARDVSLSANRAWGKDMVRNAQFWVDRVSAFQLASAPFRDDVLEVRYEDLVDEPRPQLIRMSDFIGVEFDEAMTRLAAPVENLGDAKGHSVVLRSNTQKYVHGMKPKMRRRIEAIAAPILRHYRYPVDEDVVPCRLSEYEMALSKLRDGLNLLRFRVKKWGLLGGISWTVRAYIYSGNRFRPELPNSDL